MQLSLKNFLTESGVRTLVMCLRHFCLNRAPVLQAQGVFCQCRELFIWECRYKTPLQTLQLPHFCFYLAWSCYKQAIWIKEKKLLKMGFFLWWLSWNVSREDTLVFFTFSPTNFLLSRFDISPNPSDFHERFLDSPSNLLLGQQSQTLVIVTDSSAVVWVFAHKDQKLNATWIWQSKYFSSIFFCSFLLAYSLLFFFVVDGI